MNGFSHQNRLKRGLFARLKAFLGSTPILSLILAVAICLITENLEFQRVEAFFYDLRVKVTGHGENRDDIVLIPIDEESNLNSPINSIVNHTKALENLIAHKPKAIVFLNRFDSSDIQFNTKEAEKFVRLAQEAAKSGTKVILGSDVDLSGEILAPYPLNEISHYPAVIHKDGTIFGEDKVSRRALLTVLDQASIHLKLAFPELSDSELKEKVKSLRGAYYFEPGEVWHLLLQFQGEASADQLNYKSFSFEKAVSNKISENLDQKIILIDSLRRDSLNDYVLTPYTKDTYQFPKLVLQAVTLQTILDNSGIVTLPHWLDFAITLLLCFALTFVTLRYSPTRGVVGVVTAGLFLVLISGLLYSFGGIWLKLVHPLFAMFFSYYLIVPYRAIFEYKMRWEVQQKHDLLLQVEEMKGNFLSLMSHDLKTPIARIQGLGELVLRQGGLSGEQEREIREILYSTESLDKFISKILNLTKVESSQIKLNRRSKDINKIIENCANKLRFQAENKRIKIELKLEPLFPIQIDPALIIQVLTNLMDNAIKYSPEGGSVTISSRELTDKNQIEIQVRDSGHGMENEEVNRLFTKFFRGQAASSHQLKGSGLGLYLSKYFIELHNGQINASSQKGQGSVFTINLPMLVAADEAFNEGVAHV